MEYQVGQVITVFRNRLRADDVEAYREHAAAISALATTMPGYVEHKAFTADDGERVTLVTFADAAAQAAWRVQAQHVEAQQAGVRSYYEEYSIAVGTVTHTHTWARTP